MENDNAGFPLFEPELEAPDKDFSFVEIPMQYCGDKLLALEASVKFFICLQKEKSKIDGEMARLEQKGNKVICSLGNQIGFVLSYSGASILYQHLQLPCAIVGWITFISVSCLIGGLGIAIWAARMELRRMIPSVKNLDITRKALAERAEAINAIERVRLENLNERLDDRPLHPTVTCKSVIMWSKMIKDSERYLTRFEQYNRLFIWAAIICVVVNGAGICCIAYYSYCHVDVLGCKNSMMQPQRTKMYNLREESCSWGAESNS